VHATETSAKRHYLHLDGKRVVVLTAILLSIVHKRRYIGENRVDNYLRDDSLQSSGNVDKRRGGRKKHHSSYLVFVVHQRGSVTALWPESQAGFNAKCDAG